MDYKKKYNEALERANKYNFDGAKQVVKDLVFYIFPELKESEDERISKLCKELIESAFMNELCNKEERDTCIAWLEKQGNKDNQETLPPFTFDDVLALQCCMETVKKVQEDKELYKQLQSLHNRLYDAYQLEKQGESYTKKDVDDAYIKGVCDAKQELEKQGEQEKPQVYETEDGEIITYSESEGYKVVKPKFKVGDIIIKSQNSDINKFGKFKITGIKDGRYWYNEFVICEISEQDEWELVPKFHEGDWITCKEFNTALIVNVKGDKYEVEFVDGNKGFSHIDYIDRLFHLWTIQDAKDGDILVASDGSLFVFTQVKDNSAYYHYSLCKNGSQEISDGKHAWETAKGCHPATKEQHDTLMKAMANAGWEFDFEKKELMKIEKNTDVNHEYFSELLENDDSKDINDYAYQVAYCMSHDWLKDTATWEDVQKAVKLGAEWNERHHNSSWSEEDAVNFNLVYTYVPDDSLRDWLKELKDRVQPQNTWKPSDEQMEVLYEETQKSDRIRDERIVSLYNDLKKLKGE